MKKIAIVLAVMAVIVGFLLVKDYDSPELGQVLLREVGDATGIEMSATGFRFNLFKGVELENVQATSSSEGRELAFTLDQLVFEHRLLPLLSGTVAIDRIVLERPQFELVESGAAADSTDAEPAEPTDDAEGGGLALQVDQILVRDGSMVLRNTGTGSETRVEGLDLTMDQLQLDPKAESLAALSAEGELGIARVVLDTMALSDVKSRFQLQSAVFDLEELLFSTEHGEFTANAHVDFNPVPFTYTMSARGDPLDVNAIVGAADGMGPGNIELEAEGAGADTKDVRASGALNLAAGQFPESQVFAGIDKALGKNVLAGAPYEATRASFTMNDNVVRLAPFRFTTEHARLDLEGTMSLEGPIDFRLAVATPREGVVIDGVGSNVLDVLADDAGWVPVPMTISGTMEAPKVRPDAQTLVAQAAKGAKRQATQAAKEAATDALKGLFGRKKKKN